MTNVASLKSKAEHAAARLASASLVVEQRRGERDRAITAAADAGVTYDELAAITGLSYAGVSKILRQLRATTSV